MEKKKTDSQIMWERGRFLHSNFTQVMIINILFYYSFVIFKRFNNALIVVYWVLLVSPNFLNHGDDLISHLSKFKSGV